MQQTDQPDDRTLLEWVLEASVRVGPNHGRSGQGFRAYKAKQGGGVTYLPGEGVTRKDAAVAAYVAVHQKTDKENR